MLYFLSGSRVFSLFILLKLDGLRQIKGEQWLIITFLYRVHILHSITRVHPVTYEFEIGYSFETCDVTAG